MSEQTLEDAIHEAILGGAVLDDMPGHLEAAGFDLGATAAAVQVARDLVVTHVAADGSPWTVLDAARSLSRPLLEAARDVLDEVRAEEQNGLLLSGDIAAALDRLAAAVAALLEQEDDDA